MAPGGHTAELDARRGIADTIHAQEMRKF